MNKITLDDEDRDDWERLAKLVEEKFTSTNTGSPKFPTEGEVARALPAFLPPTLDAKSVAFGAKVAHAFIGRKLRVGA